MKLQEMNPRANAHMSIITSIDGQQENAFLDHQLAIHSEKY